MAASKGDGMFALRFHVLATGHTATGVWPQVASPALPSTSQPACLKATTACFGATPSPLPLRRWPGRVMLPKEVGWQADIAAVGGQQWRRGPRQHVRQASLLPLSHLNALDAAEARHYAPRAAVQPA